MSSTSRGRQAEDAAAEYLRQKGFRVREQNWRTRYCEIDIVAEQGNCIYFVEVKYRESNTWGGGLEYVTPKKLQQMAFAAEMWVHDHHWNGAYQLAAIEVGADYQVTDFVCEL